MIIRKAKLSDLDGMLNLHLTVCTEAYYPKSIYRFQMKTGRAIHDLHAMLIQKPSLYVAETEPGKLIGFAAGLSDS